MPKHLFLTSQIHFVVHDIANTLEADKNRPMVFIDTCLKNRSYTDAELDWHYANKEQLLAAGFHYDIYDISGKPEDQIKNDLDQYGIMYIEGGNTPYLLQQAQKNNFAAYVRKRVESGMIYTSTSAGSVIAGPDISTHGRPGKMPADYDIEDPSGFKLVNFVVSPHWGDPKKVKDYREHKIPQSYSSPHPHILIHDNQYVEVIGDSWQIHTKQES